MRYNIKITETARKDLQEITNYIAISLQEREHAKRQLRRIGEAISALETLPERYPLVEYQYLAHKGYRVVPQDRYFIFYQVIKKKQLVYISRILYGKRDWKNLL